MYICIYVCMYKCKYVYMYIWTYVHMYIHIYIYEIYVYMYIHVYTYVYMHRHTHTLYSRCSFWILSILLSFGVRTESQLSCQDGRGNATTAESKAAGHRCLWRYFLVKLWDRSIRKTVNFLCIFPVFSQKGSVERLRWTVSEGQTKAEDTLSLQPCNTALGAEGGFKALGSGLGSCDRFHRFSIARFPLVSIGFIGILWSSFSLPWDRLHHLHHQENQAVETWKGKKIRGPPVR